MTFLWHFPHKILAHSLIVFTNSATINTYCKYSFNNGQGCIGLGNWIGSEDFLVLENVSIYYVE